MKCCANDASSNGVVRFVYGIPRIQTSLSYELPPDIWEQHKTKSSWTI